MFSAATLEWYRKTLASTGAAKRANRNFKEEPPDHVGSVRSAEDHDALIADGIVPERWRALIWQTVYYFVKTEEIQKGSLCPGCHAEKLRTERLMEEGSVPIWKQDLETRTRDTLKRFLDPSAVELENLLVRRIMELYRKEGDKQRVKIIERRSPCRKCRPKEPDPEKSPLAKRVSFDCSSLFSRRSEAIGSRCSSGDSENGLYGYVNVVADRPAPKRNPGLLEVPDSMEDTSTEDDDLVVPNGKRVIGSVGGVEALSWGFIEDTPAELLIDSGAVACLVHSRVLARLGLSHAPRMPYVGSLNGVSGSVISIRSVIDLPVTLGSVERRIPFAVVDTQHVDAILGTNALRDFRAVVDLDANTVTLKDTGEVFPIGSPRVEECCMSRITSNVRVYRGAQALVVADVQGEVKDGTTVLVEGLATRDDTVKVARSLCTVCKGRVIVEVCNPTGEDVIIKRGTLLASLTVVLESAFSLGALTIKSGSKSLAKSIPPLPQPPKYAIPREPADWIHTVEGAADARPENTETPPPDPDRDPEEELEVDLESSKLGDEQRELFREVLQPFKDMFVETSMRPGRTDLLEFSIDTGDHAPIKQPPYRVSKAEATSWNPRSKNI